MIDERQSRNSIARRELAFLKKDDQHIEFDSTGTSKGQLGQNVKVCEGICEPSKNLGISGKAREPLKHIPRIYNRWEHLFQEEETTKALPKHQSWDHEIKLESSKEPTFGPIYALSKKELSILRKYLAENEKKGFIKKSQSRAGYSILFTPKKDEELRLYVDYRKLNDITIKNRYPLPNINELQDRLFEAKYFIKLDLRGAYN